VRKTYLSFQTGDSKKADEWSQTGLLLLHRLGNALESLGYLVDYEAGRDESDWLFAARREEVSFALVLALFGCEPCRWFTYLEGEGFKALEAPKITDEVHPTMQAAVASHPGVSHLRWHEDNTTLREV
jgi:hypothetical protein